MDSVMTGGWGQEHQRQAGAGWGRTDRVRRHYTDGAEEHHLGQLLEVSWLATGAGLHQVHDPDGFRWAKDWSEERLKATGARSLDRVQRWPRSGVSRSGKRARHPSAWAHPERASGAVCCSTAPLHPLHPVRRRRAPVARSKVPSRPTDFVTASPCGSGSPKLRCCQPGTS